MSCNHKQVERIWRVEELKVLARQPKRGRFCMAGAAEPRGSLEVEEYTCDCLVIRRGHQLKAADVIDVLSDLFILCGTPRHVRSNNEPEFVAIVVKA